MYLSLELPDGPEWTLFILTAVIIIGPLLVERLGIPGIIGLLIGGLIIGPNGLDLVQDTETLSRIGEIGLLYLMFLAGLELDLVLFRQYRRAALIFYALTFSLPFALAFAGGLLTGYETAAAILIGSIWASHTLVTYPVVKRFGLAQNRAVAVTVGATVLTDTTALLILAVVSGTESGGESGIQLIAELSIGLVVLIAYCAIVLPPVARWFFKGVGQERTMRFIFVLACLTSAAMIAEEGGIEGIVGAFFAGIALNRLIPNASPLFERTEFFGSSFFIPIFLISVGLLIDLEVLADPETVKLAAVFAAAVVAGKASAAFIAGRIFKFSGAEAGVMFSLSLPQAAATLAATLIGFNIGLLDQEFVNAAIVVIGASLLIASLAANRFSPEVPAEDEPGRRRLGEKVLVDVTDPQHAEHLIAFAAQIAEADSGTIVPIFVSTADHDPSPDLAAAKDALGRAVTAAGLDAEPVVRIDRSHIAGVVHAETQYDATLLLIERSGGLTAQDIVFGASSDDLITSSPVPVVIAAISDESIGRVVLRVDSRDLRPARWPDVRLAADLARLLSNGTNLVVVTSDVETLERAANVPQKAERIVAKGDTGTWARVNARKGDLFVVPGSLGPWVFGSGPSTIASIPGVSVAVIAGPGRVGGSASGESLGTRVVGGRSG